jgi:YfiH family protein
VERGGFQGEGDALVSADPTLVLLVAVADCNPVLVWEEAGPLFACAHAGWRGLRAGIVEATIRTLLERGARSPRLRAWIGPSISVDHFEVDEDVAALFPTPYRQRRTQWAKSHLDLKRAAGDRLIQAGVAGERIAICPDCTHGRPELYFSYRRDRGICGRHLAYITRC